MQQQVHLRTQSDEELMALIQRHRSSEALVEIHRRYSPKLLGYFYKMLHRDEDLAQDFTQEIFLKLLEKNKLFDTNKKFYTWIFTIASNMCKTAYRHYSKTESFHESINDSAIFAKDHFETKNFQTCLDKALETLEDGQKETLVLRFLEGFSLNEVAEIQEISLGTVKSRLFYGTKKLAAALKEFDPSFEQNIFKLM